MATCPRVTRIHATQGERPGTEKYRHNPVLGKEIWVVATAWQSCYLYNTHLVSILGAFPPDTQFESSKFSC